MSETWKADRIGAALRGENPTVLARLPAGFAVMGDVQWLPGYCVLLTDDPTATRLSDLAPAARSGVPGEHGPARRGVSGRAAPWTPASGG